MRQVEDRDAGPQAIRGTVALALCAFRNLGLSSNGIAGLVRSVRAGVPIRTDLLEVRCRGHRPLWYCSGRLNGP
jgi:hypothetical protein